jgi:hypothetical protein
MNSVCLTIPLTGAEIQQVGEVKYLVARLDDNKTCAEYASDLRKGVPVVVPASKRGHLSGLLKKESIYTRHQTVPGGKWVSFIPCEKRDFKA